LQYSKDEKIALNNYLPHIELPFTNPVIIFSLVLFIILLAPQIFKRLKVPGIVGIILSGIIIGPHGLKLLAMDSSFILFGTVGLLYLMFLAGIELDFNEFISHKFKSILYGFLLFFISNIIGLSTFYYILHYELVSSFLLSSAITSFTLVSYPIVSRLGLVKYKTMPITIGGLIVADLLSLFELVLIKTFQSNSFTSFFVIKLSLSLVFYIFILFYLYPKVTKWYFRKTDLEGAWQYIYVLAMLLFSCFLAELSGLEPIIGAFAAGLTLNRLIPKNSILMDRINFIGNSIFIPFFLIQIGMMINVGVVFKSYEVIGFALLLQTLAVISKFSTAFIIQKIFKLSKDDRMFMFGLSISQAAALLAIALVGFKLNIIAESVFDSTVLVILISSLISTFITENVGKRIVVQLDKEPKLPTKDIQRIMTPISNPDNIGKLVEFSFMIKDKNSTEPIIALRVVEDEEMLQNNMEQCLNIINSNVKKLSPSSVEKIILTSRIHLNVPEGIIRAAKENFITDLVIGINPKASFFSKLFGNLIKNILDDFNKNIFIVHNPYPLNTIDQIFVILPEFAEYEVGFNKVIKTIFNLSMNSNVKVNFIGLQKTLFRIKTLQSNLKLQINYNLKSVEKIEDIDELNLDESIDNFFIFVDSRNKGISHNIFYSLFVKKSINKYSDQNLCLIYPEQNPSFTIEDIAHFDILETSPINENIAIYKQIQRKIRQYFKKKK
jgi:Kef-type K+ transport system membrane component KefB